MARRQSVFVKFFFSSSVILLIPAFIIFIVYYNKNVAHLREEIIYYNVARVRQMQELLDERIKECNNISALASLNSRLNKRNIEKEPYNAMEGIKEIKKYMAGNEFIEDLFIYYGNDSLMYSSNGTTSVNVVLQNRYGFSENDYQRFLELIDCLETASIYKFRSSDTVVYMRPLSSGRNSEYGVTVFLFSGRSIRNLLGNSYPDFNGIVYILSEDNVIMTSDYKGDCVADDKIETFIAGWEEEGYASKNFHGTDFSIFLVNSDQTLLRYAIVTGTNQLMRQVAVEKTIAGIVAVLVIITCLFTSWAFAAANYKPIGQLNRIATSYLPNMTDNIKNEIENIGFILENVIRKNRDLNYTLDNQRELLRDSILTRLLRGEFGNADDFWNLTKNAGINFSNRSIAVMAIDISNERLQKYNEIVIDFIHRQTDEEETCYALEIRNDNILAIICNLERESCQERQHALADIICNFYSQSLGESVKMGIGKTYMNILEARYSYAEACSEIRYLYGEEDSFGFFKETIYRTFQFGQHFTEDKVYYIHCLKQGNQALVEYALDTLIEKMIKRKLSGAEEKYECYTLLHDIINNTNDFWENNGNQVCMGELSDKFQRCLYYSRIEDYHVNLKEFSNSYCRAVAGMIDVREEELKNKLMDYIGINFKDPNLSLDSISQVFGYSGYYWSRYFKEKFKCLFSEYIWKMRLEEAKRLLKESDKTVKDIVLEVGYTDSTAFIKKFRNEEGMTPGSFRKINRKFEIFLKKDERD